ncbi:hypothetical protein IQ273_08610 [Nodosilinea sp. LEGE 07298]|nr:hypothetical protein [Nodosilinea sp. LEGE 07298]MBE9109475.1 hypothetical protein [Nodosilinea sp. LEGE 07298]
MVSQLSRPLPSDRIAPSDPQQLLQLRHTCAHVLAMAVQRLFPETRVTIGPSTETGFYYDFDRAMVEDRPLRAIAFTPDDLTRIEAEMRQIICANLPIVRETVERDELRAEIAQLHEPYNLEILDGIPSDEPIIHYYIGCPDPVLPSTKTTKRLAISLQQM